MLIHGHSIPVKPERVVVLGAGGFIGKAVLALLSQGGVPSLALGSAQLDLTVPGAGAVLAAMLRPTDTLLMLSVVAPRIGRGRDVMLRNLAMMDAVCAAIEAVPVAHVIYLSSDAVFPFGIELIDEQSPMQPSEFYGAMHRSRELMIGAAGAMPVAVLRPTMVFGNGDTHNAYGPNRFRRQAAAEGRIVLGGGGEETRDHIHVEDIARLIALTAFHRSAGSLNLGTGRSVSFDVLARMVAARFPNPIEVVHGPRTLPITHRHFDVTALHKAFPTFRALPLEEGVARCGTEG